MLKSPQNNNDCSQTNSEQQIHKLKYKKLKNQHQLKIIEIHFIKSQHKAYEKYSTRRFCASVTAWRFKQEWYTVSIRDAQSNQWGTE